MDRDNRKDLYGEGIDYSYISLISEKLRVGIIGGGKAGVIKAKHFVKNKCYVEVLSKDFNDEMIELHKSYNEQLKLISKPFDYSFLEDKHLVIIALNDENLKNIIREYCEEKYKIYIDSSDFKNGMGVVPAQRSTENVTFALNTQYGNPKGSVLLANKVEKLLKEYDDFMKFIGRVRNKAKEIPEHKDDIIEFVTRDEFKKAFDAGKSEEELRLKFSKDIVDYILEV